MLYSVPIKLDKEYRIKIGLREVKLLQESNIDFENTKGIYELLTIISLSLKIEKDGKLERVEISNDHLLDLIDSSEYGMEEIMNILEEAMELGMYKGKQKKTSV